MSKVRAIIMKPSDNVCTVVEAVEPPVEAIALSGENQVTVLVTERIPFGHKFAVRAIKKGEAIIKYGETIGLATKEIQPGQHVHVHNLESCRGRGDKGR
jgi:altronate dehydratase small subunit